MLPVKEFKSWDILNNSYSLKSLNSCEKHEVLIKVEKVVLDSGFCLEGTGIVIETGLFCTKFLGKRINFIQNELSQLPFISEYLICDSKFCFMPNKENLLLYKPFLSLMIKDFLIKKNAKIVAHVSDDLLLGKMIEKLCENEKFCILRINSKESLKNFEIFEPTIVLLGKNGCFGDFGKWVEKGCEVVLYEKSVNINDIDPSLLIYKDFKIKGLSLYSWLKGLTMVEQDKYLKNIENNPVFLYSPEIRKNNFFNLFPELLSIQVKELFKTKIPKHSENKKSKPGLVCETSSLSVSKPLNTNLEDIINLSCLESPDTNLSLSFLKLFSTSAQSTSYSTRKKSFSLDFDYELEKTETYSAEFLSSLIKTYRNPEVFEIVFQLSKVFFPNPLFFTSLIILPDSSIYEGQLNSQNHPKGFGTRYYKNGTVFKGFWIDGMASGQGFIVTNKGVIYTGMWKRGLYHGYGSLKSKNGDFLEGKFKNGEIQGVSIQILSNGDKYHGNFLNGARHGNGSLQWKSGISYFGSFCNGEIFGNGKVLYKNKIFIGDFEGNIATGVMHYSDLSKFHGKIVDFIETGEGVYENSGVFYKCCIKDGEIEMYDEDFCEFD